MNRVSFLLLIYILSVQFFLTGKAYARKDSLIKLSGKILDAETGKPIKAHIFYEKLPYGDDVGITCSKLEDGSYQFNIIHQYKYSIEVKADGFLTYYEEINASELSTDGEITKDIHLATYGIGQIFRLNKIMFKQSEATMVEGSTEELNGMVRMLKSHPKMIIQLEGHTDFRGDEGLNYKLSESRVDAVQSYLIKHGIKKKRIKVKAFGGSNPITRESSEEAMDRNRRVEVRILHL